MRYLTPQNLLGIHERIPSAGPVKDLGLLDSALARPSSSFAGAGSYATIGLTAAALLDALCNDRGLIDGQKWMALVGTVACLRLNGHDTTLSSEEAHDLVLDAAAGLHDLDVIARRLSTRARERR